MAVHCPFCKSERAELISLFGSQLLFSQYRCQACGSYFEAIRDQGSAVQPETANDSAAAPESDHSPG